MTPREPDKQRTKPAGPGLDPSEGWTERCARLFEEMRRPARAMVARAYGRAMNDDEIDDVYSAAWAATLSALRDRGSRMEEGELRAYLLTAVASHASKEMRRRSRKPLAPLDAEREQASVDGHVPLPDEIAIGSEARGVARDLLTSLPVRRRAVMLLRYGWGLSPREVCALVPGLSPRAYRKEITRGVEELIDGLDRVESGDWCADREPLVRDLVAGTADEPTRRQALEHLQHCRACSDLAARLSHHLHEAGGVIALATVAGCIGGGLPLLQRIGELLGGIKATAASGIEKAHSGAAALVASGGAKGSGTAGAGFVANLAGVGGAAKAAVACIGAGAAATACVAAGVVPGVSLEDDAAGERRPEASRQRAELVWIARPQAAISSVIDVSKAVEAERHPPPEHPTASAPDVPEPTAPEPEPVEQPVTPAPVEEFDPVAAAAPAAAPAASGGSGSSPSGGGSAAASVAQNEFGP